MLHRHSTAFGLGATTVLIVVVGEVSHWSAILTTTAGLLGIAILPRLFYGFSEARALDKERASGPGYFGYETNMWDGSPTEEERLERAIGAAEGSQLGPDTSALQRLAEEEKP